MVIQCGKDRRLRSYRYGWVIEKRYVKKEDGSEYWGEDSPAYPANLACAFESVLERVLVESGDCDVSEVPQRLQAAYRAVKDYGERARRAA